MNYSIFRIGTNEELDDQEARSVVLSNQITFVFLLVSVPYIYIFEKISQSVLSMSVFPFVVLFFSAFIFNYFRRYAFAKSVLVLTSNCALLFYATVLGPKSGIHYIFFALVTIPFILYLPKYAISRYLSSALPILFLFWLDLGIYHPFILDVVVYPSGLKFISSTMIFITFVILFFSFRMFYLNSYNSEAKLQESVRQLTDANISLKDTLRELLSTKAAQTEMSNQVAYAEMVRGIAHEIKNPLYMIRGNAETMVAATPDKSRYDSAFRVIINSVDRLIKVIAPMLKYGRPISEVTPTQFSIESLLNEIAQLSEGLSRQKSLTLSVSVPPNLGVYADRESIAQVVINLVLNAQQYTPEGGEIRLSAESSTFLDMNDQLINGICIFVEDTGCGMSKERVSKIFDPFYSTKSDKHNVGLGLSIVYRYVCENRGRIEVASQEGVGSIFKVHLPSGQVAGVVTPRVPDPPKYNGITFADDVFLHTKTSLQRRRL